MRLKTFPFVLTWSFVAIFFLLQKAKPVFATNYNLVQNPSFEDGQDFPTSWIDLNESFCNIPVYSYQASTEWNSSKANIGNKSVGIKNIDLPNPGNQTSVKIASDYIQINSSETYNLSALVQGASGNKGIKPEILVCLYDKNGTKTGLGSAAPLYPPDGQTWYGISVGGITLKYLPPTTTQVRIGMLAYCDYQFLPPGAPQDCSGSVWFDDVSLQPIGTITTHFFDDQNQNSVHESNEPNLEKWGIWLYKGFDCQDSNKYIGGWTDSNGDKIDNEIPFGEYSVQETYQILDLGPPARAIDAKQEGWVTTTPLCQNVTLDSPFGVTVNIGNFHGPSFPYLSQLDPNWKNLTYDHASADSPYFCGTTIGGCGCAITSSAMLLNYYGANKAPNGQPTNPATLNDWLKQNSGYAFGALKWNSVAAYSVKANTAFGTQKIRFVSVGSANDFQTLDSDLANNKPDILEEPGHFIVASEKNSPTYAISDPAYQSRQTLAAYQNSFSSMRRFEKTNTDLSALYISTPTPNDLFITDSLGRRAGKDPQSGQVLTEIPNSYYFLEPSLIDQTQQNAQTPNSGVSTLVIINPPQDTFNLQSQSGPIDVSAYDTYGNIKVKNFSPISPDSFEINYSPEPDSDFSVFQKVAIEVKPQNLNKGNGIIPIVIESDDNFNAQDVDFGSIRFTSTQIIPIKFPLLVQNGKDNKKDLQVFFYVNEIPPDPNLCLTGITMEGLTFKGCST